MNTKPLTFALAGKLVSSPAQARAIWSDAIRTGKAWLIPQARNVYILLKRAQVRA